MSWKPTQVLLATTTITFVSCLYSFNIGTLFKAACVQIVLYLGITLVVRGKRAGDLYGSFHIPFNILPGSDPNLHPDTEWLNMGYWKHTQAFPLACEALALKLIHAANCSPSGRVLDVGHACGDSLLLQLSHPKIPRPISLTGITDLPFHHTSSRDRIAKLKSLHPQTSSCEVMLYCGDVIFRSQDANHPLNPSSSTPAFSSILALDCAYHFASREIFLRQSFARLSPGGTIALADLAVLHPLPFVIRTVLSKALSVRSENMITPQIYEAQLKTIGYNKIRLEDITDDVFPGFRTFLKSRGGLWVVFELVIGWWVRAGGRFLMVSASKPATGIGSEIHSH